MASSKLLRVKFLLKILAQRSVPTQENACSSPDNWRYEFFFISQKRQVSGEREVKPCRRIIKFYSGSDDKALNQLTYSSGHYSLHASPRNISQKLEQCLPVADPERPRVLESITMSF